MSPFGKSSLPAYGNGSGFADLCSLRHKFVSNLAAGGVHRMIAQQLARHSTISLTMDRYTLIGLVDMTAALESLPTFATTDNQSSRQTPERTSDHASIDTEFAWPSVEQFWTQCVKTTRASRSRGIAGSETPNI
jgi:hypothetical protein